ncbi:hypothetical protein A2U01_0081841, partial [Trifolium medium]|nr:hypothetical protein [Trifolium medium]
YTYNVFPCSGRVRIGGDAKNAFNLWKSSSHWGLHVNLSLFLNLAKKWNAFSPARDKNMESAAILPVNYWTSLTKVGLLISMMA